MYGFLHHLGVFPILVSHNETKTVGNHLQHIGKIDLNQVLVERLPGRHVNIPAFDSGDDDATQEKLTGHMFLKLLKLKKGAKLMVTRPTRASYHGNLHYTIPPGCFAEFLSYNSTRGSRRNDTMEMLIEHEGRPLVVNISRTTLRSEDDESVFREQFPVVYGYALTPRQCQSITLSQAVSILHYCFQPGEVNVMLSRVSSLRNVKILGGRSGTTPEGHIRAIWEKVNIPAQAQILNDYLRLPALQPVPFPTGPISNTASV